MDLFTTSLDVTAFSTAVDQVSDQLRGSGYQVEQTRRSPQFARLHVAKEDGLQLEVDLGVDWRQDEPVTLDVGPVLSLADAVGSKVGALYSRGEVRDYLDVDAIRTSGRFSDDQLLTAAAERDAGFEVDMFVWRLDAAARISVDDVSGTPSPLISCRPSRSGAGSGPPISATRPACTEAGTEVSEKLRTVIGQVRLSNVRDQGDPVAPQQ